MQNLSSKAQIGIGTLIVFIALVLVAAIAAGVLINSADLLQQRGESTSEDAIGEVSNQLVVTSTLGNVVDPNDNNYNNIAIDEAQVTTIKLNVRTASGSGKIDLRQMSIDYLRNADTTFTFGDESGNGNIDLEQDPGENFVTEDLTGEDSDTENTGYILESGERTQIRIGLLEDSSSLGYDQALSSGETARITLVTASGAETIVKVQAPNSLSIERGNVIQL